MSLFRGERLALAAALGVAGCLLYVGWSALWFLTDDAFIAFRYVSNSVLGHGYVWNPPPFRPVEGYTSFLWVVLLDGVWRAFGVDPPEAANRLSLLFSFGSLLVATWMVLSLPLRPALRRYRTLFAALVLLGIATNRTFLTWASSGLETALFDLLLLLWVACALGIDPGRTAWALSVSLCAALLALARPDGLLFAVATAVGVAWAGARRARGARRAAWLAGLPLLAVPAHLLWRRATYGEWLPNTYYAKYTSPWPESGITYATSFIVEYSLWIWLIPALLLVLPGRTVPAPDPSVPAAPRAPRAVAGGVLAALLLHLGYYTFVIGGDHFEYRVYSHLVVLLYVSFLWMLAALTDRAAPVAVCLALFVAASWPVSWSHWLVSREHPLPPDAYQRSTPLAPHWPAAVRWYAAAFDELQTWLAAHFVGMGQPKHRRWTELLEARYPSRAEGLALASEGFPVLFEQSVGVAGWRLPRVNVIDYWGLNDYVIARSPVPPENLRTMAHQRVPPTPYVECFAPNVRVGGGRVEITPRPRALTAEDIVRCEESWAAKIAAAPRAP